MAGIAKSGSSPNMYVFPHRIISMGIPLSKVDDSWDWIMAKFNRQDAKIGDLNEKVKALELKVSAKEKHVKRLKDNAISLVRETERKSETIQELKQMLGNQDKQYEESMARKTIAMNQLRGIEDQFRMEPEGYSSSGSVKRTCSGR